jgi:hypothetical protein
MFPFGEMTKMPWFWWPNLVKVIPCKRLGVLVFLKVGISLSSNQEQKPFATAQQLRQER